jgi:hypothetical protein
MKLNKTAAHEREHERFNGRASEAGQREAASRARSSHI